MKAGQFFTFILPGIWGRAYSALDIIDNIAILIIKRWWEEDGGRWWSILLCNAEIWDIFKLVWPAGHFLLQENNENRLFLGTGTWLVPLYNMILAGLREHTGEKYQLVFWVRYMSDMFYLKEFAALKELYPDTFYYHLVVSRSEWEWIIKKWYVTDFLSSKVVSDYKEFYICWAPAMIEWCQEKLSQLWVDEEKIFFEKYA
jgi:ferredoxin-NADP reductase